jgi:hypothetical protein
MRLPFLQVSRDRQDCGTFSLPLLVPDRVAQGRHSDF